MVAWFPLKSTYGFEVEIAWRIPRWLLNAWPSLISERNDMSNSGSRSIKIAVQFLAILIPYLFWASMVAWFPLKSTYGFEVEIAWRIPRWLLNAWPSLISERNDMSNSGSPFCLSFCSRRFMVWKKILFEVPKTAAMVAQHNDSASCESTIPSLMPYKLSHCDLQTWRCFLESFERFRKLTLSHQVFQTYTQPNISILIGIIPYDSTLKHYFVEK